MTKYLDEILNELKVTKDAPTPQDAVLGTELCADMVADVLVRSTPGAVPFEDALPEMSEEDEAKWQKLAASVDVALSNERKRLEALSLKADLPEVVVDAPEEDEDFAL